MFEWLMLFFTPVAVVPDAKPTQKDVIGLVAAEVSYSALLHGSPLAPVGPVNPEVDHKDCLTCGGTGKVPSGDGQGWTKCANYRPKSTSGTAPIMKLQERPLPVVTTGTITKSGTIVK